MPFIDLCVCVCLFVCQKTKLHIAKMQTQKHGLMLSGPWTETGLVHRDLCSLQTKLANSWNRAQERLGVSVVTTRRHSSYRLFSSWLSMWKCYSITLCLNATWRNKRRNRGDDLYLDWQLVYTCHSLFWSCRGSAISENVSKHVTTHVAGAWFLECVT